MVERFRPGSIDYDGVMSTNFDAGRPLIPAMGEAWRNATLRHFDTRAVHQVLDLGSGTGRWSGLLGEWFDAPVVAVEPSAGMRTRASRTARVGRVGASAEALPLRSSTCDVAWLSNVIHHITDRDACASELARVLRRDGRALLRQKYAGMLDGITLWQFFPGARRVAEAFPSLDDVAAAFESAGFVLEAVESVDSPSFARMADMLEAARLRADTTLALLDDDEFDTGLAALEEAASADPDAAIVDVVELVTFRLAG